MPLPDRQGISAGQLPVASRVPATALVAQATAAEAVAVVDAFRAIGTPALAVTAPIPTQPTLTPRPQDPERIEPSLAGWISASPSAMADGLTRQPLTVPLLQVIWQTPRLSKIPRLGNEVLRREYVVAHDKDFEWTAIGAPHTQRCSQPGTLLLREDDVKG